MRSAEWGAEQQQLQENTQQELARVYKCIEQHLSPNDQKLMLWALGLEEEKNKWSEGQEALFI